MTLNIEQWESNGVTARTSFDQRPLDSVTANINIHTSKNLILVQLSEM